MPDPGLARRYAQALFAVAARRQLVETVESDLQATARLLREDRRLRAFLDSPRVLEEHRVAMLEKVLGERVEPLVLHFLRLLLDKQRFDQFAEVVVAFNRLADAHHGIVRARVTTAVELRAELRQRLQERLAATTGKQIILDCRVDPRLIGGISVVMGDRLLDGSVSRALARLRNELGQVSVIGVA